MKNELRALLIVTVTVVLAAACAGQGERVSDSAAEPPPAVPAPGVLIPSSAEGLAPIPGHPPVTMSGALKSVDPKVGAITFEDGRTVMVSRESEVLVPISVDQVRPGTPIVVRNALPVGVGARTAVAAGKSQRMATVTSVDESEQLVELTDGTEVRVSSSTQLHHGIDGPSIGLADLRPGDELVIVTDDAAVAAERGAAPSASPRSSTPEAPRPAREVMIFRPTWIP
jgi:hypothetical protein